MKVKLNIILIVLISQFLFIQKAFSANEQFRSISSGNWDSNSTWEMSTNNGTTWIPATLTPTQNSGIITIRNPNTVTVTVNVSADQLTVNAGAALSLNAGTIFTLLDGSGFDFTLDSVGTVSGSGIFQTQGTDLRMNIRNGSNFNAPLKVNTGTTTVNDQGSPFAGKLFGTVTIDNGATLIPGNSSYFLEAYNDVTNNGTIAGINNASFVFRGSNLINNNSISTYNFVMDSTSSISGAGNFTSRIITIPGSGNISLLSDVTFSPITSFNISGTLNPNAHTFTFNSGTLIIQSGGIISNSGIVRTQGTVSMNIRDGSGFNAPLKVNSGTTTANDQTSPYIGRLFGAVTVDIGATLTSGSGYTIETHNNIINNGTIAGAGGTRPNLILQTTDQDTTSFISGTGIFSSTFITIGNAANISLAGNVTFSPVSGFTVDTSGTFNPNTYIFTFNSGAFIVHSGGTVANSGIVRTQGNPSLDLREGSNFNAPLVVNSGTTTANSQISPYIGRLYGTVTVNIGATLTSGSGYTFETHDDIINNGTIAGTGGNNVNLVMQSSGTDTTSFISGSGTFSCTKISVGNSANISLASDITFSPVTNFTIDTLGTLNPNARVFTFNSGTFTVSGGGTVVNSGKVRTQGSRTLDLREGSNFNAPLEVNTGVTSANNQVSPYAGRLYGTVTVNSGATLSSGFGYSLETYNNITNNGTIAGSLFRLKSMNLINNGIINVLNFYFETGLHSLQGAGTWTTSANILNGGIVTLASDHQMLRVNIDTGGTFNISNYTLKLTASNPITQNGTLTTTNSKIEYNGTALQSVSFANINYAGLRINNAAGATLLNNITVNDTLSVILGKLNLNARIITLPPTGYLTETPGNVIFGTSGYITTTRNVGTPNSLNVGGLGAVLTATTNLGVTEIRRGHTVQAGLNGGTSIRRYFEITPTNNTGLNAGLIFRYDDSELNGKPEQSLRLFKSTNTGSTWLFMGGGVNIIDNYITLSGLTSFSRWSADTSGAIPGITTIMEGFYNIGTDNLNMSDTVRAYLRNISSPYAAVDSSVGIIDSLTFKYPFQFQHAPSGMYFIQLKHRNSLETWSNTGVNYLQDSILNYDFTFTASQAYGNNEILKGTKYCLYSGDVTQDGFIDLTDVILINNGSNAFQTGYVANDVNGNKIVDLTDVLISYNNSNNFVVRKSPLNP